MIRSAHSDHIPFGIWVYLMSDCILFASLFAAYAVLHNETALGPTSVMLFDRSFVLIETLLLLASSFTCGLALVFLRWQQRIGAWTALALTFALGAAFLVLELREFGSLIAEGHSWQASAFLSSFFTLVATHGLHVFVGLLWLIAIMAHLALRGMTRERARMVFYFSLFWHFLDIVWICVFSLVYLLGSLPL